MKKVKLSEITPDPENPNRHTIRGQAIVADSLDAYGWVGAGVLDAKNRIIDKNLTTEQAVAAGFEDAVIIDVDGNTAVFVRRADLDLDTDRGRALSYILNQAAVAGIDFDPFRVQLDMDRGVDLSAVFTPAELDAFRSRVEREAEAAANDGDPLDRPVDPKARAIEEYPVKPGDVWLLGPHVLVCGDSSTPGPWEMALECARADVCDGIVTSPPYAMQRTNPGQYGGIQEDLYSSWFVGGVATQADRFLARTGSFFVNLKEHANPDGRATYVLETVLAMAKTGWTWTECFIWRHAGTPRKPRRTFKNQYEPIWQFTRPGEQFVFRPEAVMKPTTEAFRSHGGGSMAATQGVVNELAHHGPGAVDRAPGMAYPGNVLSFGQNQDRIGHSAMYPPGLPAWFMLAYSDEAALWVDPFCGAGTTILAADRNNRRAAGIEILPENVALAIWRYKEQTGKRVELYGQT